MHRTFALLLALQAFATTGASAQARTPTKSNAAPAPLPPPASSQPPAAASLVDSLDPLSAGDYRAGLALFDTGDFVAASARFQAAFERSHDPRLLWNVAVCEKNQRHYAAVLRLLERYLELGGAKMSAEQRSEASDVITAVRALVSTVQLRVDQRGAEVFVDDVASGITPLPAALHVDLGQRRIVLTKDGFERYVIEREFSGGSQVEIDVNLRPAPREGRLQVLASAGDSIQLDGKVMGQGTWQGALLAGEHTLRVTREGMRAYSRTVTVVAGNAHSVYVSLVAADGGGLPGWVWVGAGVLAAGGLAAGGYFLLRSPQRAGPDQGTLAFPIQL